jgi:hypothetical protein
VSFRGVNHKVRTLQFEKEAIRRKPGVEILHQC